jgi:ubiquinone/menaquinone biosynthesis C-methylase UbiE
MKVPREWYKSFFKNSFYNPASPAAVKQARKESLFVMEQLKLKKGASLLDLCCGPGRHCVEFAKKGLAVTGYDFSAQYLKEARERAKKKKVPLRLARGDMRRLKFKEEFDAVVNLFTSFGYFQKFSDDIKTLAGAARALKPGGLFLIDIVHGDFVRKNFRAKSWAEMEDHYHFEERALTPDGLFNTRIKVPKKGGKGVRRSFFSRLYDKKRLSAALKKAGMRPLKFWGSFSGSPLSVKTNRLICLARKT